MNIRPFSLTHAFNAPRERLWKAWTERDQLLQWFTPKSFTMTAANLDLRPGGAFHYCQRSPDGKEMWGKFVYREIVPSSRIVLVSSFSDAQGGIARHPFAPAWPLEMLSTSTFAEANGQTSFTLEWLPLNPTDEERQIFEGAYEGMKHGWAGTFDQLTRFLAKS